MPRMLASGISGFRRLDKGPRDLARPPSCTCLANVCAFCVFRVKPCPHRASDSSDIVLSALHDTLSHEGSINNRFSTDHSSTWSSSMILVERTFVPSLLKVCCYFLFIIFLIDDSWLQYSHATLQVGSSSRDKSYRDFLRRGVTGSYPASD